MQIPLLLALTAIILMSCEQSSTDYALQWSIDIKSKVLGDANSKTDSTIVDTSKADIKEVTFYNHAPEQNFSAFGNLQAIPCYRFFTAKTKTLKLSGSCAPASQEILKESGTKENM
jgi:hypothetical protein